MTPKESFEKFLSQSQGSYFSPWEIWKEATRQAYEDVARICDEFEQKKWNFLIKGGNLRDSSPDSLAMAIRARAKEYDNEKNEPFGKRP